MHDSGDSLEAKSQADDARGNRRRPAHGERRGILLDFDHTLFDTDRFFWVDLRSAFARFAIPDDAWEKSYEAIWPIGYSLAKHIEELTRRGAIAEPTTAGMMLSALERAFSDLRSYLFPDVPGFLDAARHRGFELILLSFGDPAWQSYKVCASGIAPHFRKIVYTSQQEGKAELLDDLVPRYTELHAIDNNPAVLDAMKGQNPWMHTHLICRVDLPAASEANDAPRDRFREAARYVSVPSRLPHHRCFSLDEVPLS